MDGTVGQFMLFSGTWVPRNWLACNGSAVPVYLYPNLFTVIGTRYGGTADGTDPSDVFNLPDLTGVDAKLPDDVQHIICCEGVLP